MDWLLRLYPKAYREQYGDQIAQTAADMDDAAPTSFARARVRAHLLIDVSKSAMIARAQYAGGSLFTAPTYLKRSGLIGIALVAPFFAAIAADAVDHAATGRDLSRSWIWSTPVLATWVLVLPGVALLVALAGIVAYAAAPVDRSSHLRRLVDLRRTWLALVPLLVAAGIIALALFHDSTQCVMQNPLTTLTHLHQTWSCTTSGFLGGN